MTAARAGNGDAASAARNAKTRFAVRAFEVFVLSVGKSGKKIKHRLVFLLEFAPKD